MEFYLVYEFIYHDFDEDRNENIEFFGLFNNKEDAIKKASERIDYGVKEFNVVLLPEDMLNKDNLFKENNGVELYRNNQFDIPIYSIYIKN